MNLVNQDLVVVLFGYLREMVELEQVREWLAANVWEIAESPSPLDRMILGELELALAEYDRGDRDEHYLRRNIWFLLTLPNAELVPLLQELPSIPLAV